MKFWAAGYHVLRIVRWLLWIGFLAFSAYFASDRAPHLNQFGHLSHQTEAVMFGLPVAAVFAGIFELLFRDRAFPHRILAPK